MKSILLFAFAILLSVTAIAQYPPLQIDASVVTTATGVTVDVPITAGTNWQNITSLRGTITFDTTIITWNQMSFWGLTNPSGATFTYQGAGVITYTWASLITIGPTLSAGATVFTLRFNAVGTGGQVSPITFTNTPQILFWNNGFGWSGNNFTSSNGSVTITGCSSPTAVWGDSTNQLIGSFTDSSTGTPTSWAWDFGDGNTSSLQNPSHTYAAAGTYSVCLIATDTCGSDTLCKNVTVTSCPVALGTDTRTECNSLLWIDGNTYTASNNSATHTIVGGASTSCDSLVTLNLTIITTDKTVSQTNVTLTSNQSGVTYQWIDCNGDTPITGETNQAFNATANGSYAVIITNNGCVDTSACYTIASVDVEENKLDNEFSVYPNPFENQLTISFSELINSSYSVTIQNTLGQVIYQFQPSNQSSNIDLTSFDSGVYFVNIKNSKGTQTVRIIKQ